MQDAPKAVWSIPYVSVALFPSLKHNFIAYYSSKVSSRPNCIFEIHQLWQSGFIRVHCSFCCSSSFEAEIIKISQSFYKMYSNNILNFTTILNACTKKSGNLLKAPRKRIGWLEYLRYTLASFKHPFFYISYCVFVGEFCVNFKVSSRYKSSKFLCLKNLYT